MPPSELKRIQLRWESVGRAAASDISLTLTWFSCCRYLFDKIYLSSLPLDLEVFTNITEHPIFHRYPVELVWDATRLDLQWISEWKRRIIDCRSKRGDKKSQRDQERRATSSYRAMLAFWTEIIVQSITNRTDGREKQALASVISRGRLPAIESVVTFARPATRTLSRWNAEPDPVFISYSSSPTLRKWFRTTEYDNPFDYPYNRKGIPCKEVQGLNESFETIMEVFRTRPLQRLIVWTKSFEMNGIDLRSDDIDSLKPVSLLVDGLFTSWTSRLDNFIDIAGHLRYLDTFYSIESTACADKMLRVFQKMANLQDLRLGIRCPEDTAEAIFDHVFMSLHLPALQGLKLIHTATTFNGILEFVKRHKGSLCSTFHLLQCLIDGRAGPLCHLWDALVDCFEKAEVKLCLCVFETWYGQSIFELDQVPTKWSLVKVR